MNIIVNEDINSLRTELAISIIKAANEAISANGNFNVAFAGGSLTDSLAFGLSSCTEKTDFSRWTVFMVDERLVPLDHKDSNYGALKMKFDLDDRLSLCKLEPVDTSIRVEEAADDYTKKLPKKGLDLVVFGMGPDGHIASLFPGMFQHTDVPCIPIKNSPKPPPTRVTLSLGYLKVCKQYFFMITGAEKKAAMTKAIHGDLSLPSTHLDQSKAAWFVDKLCME